MQYQGDIYRQQPQALVAWQKNGDTLTSLKANKSQLEACRGYMADLAYDPELQLLAVTSPRGNRLTVWDLDSLQYCYSIDIAGASGIQFLKQQKVFLVSTAKGQLIQIQATKDAADTSFIALNDAIKWDNHFMLNPQKHA